MPERGVWKTKSGFYFLAIGSACSLANIWRFPYIIGENGGGAFILLYVFLAMTLGTTLMIAELIVGKSTGKSLLTALETIPFRKNWISGFLGWGAVALSLIILSYYSVISGWVLHFITQFFVGFWNPEFLQDENHLVTLMNNGWLQVLLASAHLLLTVVIVAKGVHDGIERWVSVTVPFFLLLLGILFFKSLSLPASSEALRFLLYPDFSKLNMSSFMQAIGHTLFTLAVGFGVMVTFGSYMWDEHHPPTVAFRVSILSTILSLVIALTIFPMIFMASNQSMKNPVILFEVLPQYLAKDSRHLIFGLLFFSCFYMAALNASLILLEVIVSNWKDKKRKLHRSRIAWIAGVLALGFSVLPALSMTILRDFRWMGQSLIEILDAVLINWVLPLVALLFVFLLAKSTTASWRQKHFIDVSKFVSQAMYPQWNFFLIWMVPFFLVLAFAMQILEIWYRLQNR